MSDIVKKTIQTRITQKHDIEENWNKAENFIPRKGEIIIYDKDDNHVTIRVKVGDGVTVVKSLPFITDNYYTITEINSKLDEKQDKLEPGVNLIGTDGIIIDNVPNEEKINIKVDGKVTKTPNSIVKRDNEGHVKTADAVSDEDAASYGQQKALRNYTDSELLKKLDRTGGTITGNLIVSGNLSVSGEASVIESTTLKVADKLIYVAKDNISALTSPAGLVTPKYDGTNDGGIVYDNSGTAYVGDIKLDSNGNVDVNTSDLQPIATRDVYSNFTNGHKVKAEVDSSQKSVKFIDGGKDDGINSLTNADLTFADTTVQYDTTDGIQLTSTGRFTYTDGNHDATIDLDLPIIGTDGIIIGKAAASEKIEVSGKNLIKDPYPGVNNTGADIVNFKPYNSSDWGSAFVRNTHALVENAYKGAIVGYDNVGVIYAKTTTDDPWSVVNKKYVDDNFVKKISKQIIVEQVSSGNSYELSKISSLAFTINDSSFTSVNDVCQICFATESQFDITIPDGTYVCVGDGFSIDKKTISCIANKVYYITIGYTPFGIEIVSSIDEIASNNLAA